jgi:endoglucanase
MKGTFRRVYLAVVLSVQIGCLDSDTDENSSAGDDLLVNGLDCQPTGLVDTFSWSEGDPNLFDGHSIVDLLVMLLPEMNIDFNNPCQYLTLFDYPGSRAAAEKNYTYTYVENPTRARRPGTGINMVGLHGPSEEAWGIYLHDDYFRIVAEAGFDMVRIPCRYSAFIDSTNPVQANGAFLTRIDRALTAALQNDLTVLLDVQYYPDQDILRRFTSDADKENTLNHLYELWDILAVRYREYSDRLYFELINEPRLPLTADIWNDAMKVLIPRIRSTGGPNTTRKIVVSPAGWSHIGMLEKFTIPFSVQEDPNLVASFHYYEPSSFTWQGTQWGPYATFGPAWLGNVWQGTDAQKNFIRADLDIAQQWSQTHQRSVLLTEIGVMQNADRKSRVTYLQFIREEAEQRGIPWFVWSSNSMDPFGIYDPEKGWQAEVLDALMPE